MRTVFVVNDRRELGPEQTTSLLVSAALRRGHEVLVSGVDDLTLEPGGDLVATGARPTALELEALVNELSSAPPTTATLDDQDLCVIRTNPSRDEFRRPQHLSALRLLERVQERGVRVVNAPRGLSRALTKLPLLDLPPDLHPRTLVTRDVKRIAEFVEAASTRVVIKPLDGTRGSDVFVLAKEAGLNMPQIVEVVLRRGYAMVQEFVEGAELGDVRVTILGGRILEVDGRAAAVARVPGTNDFRSNLHAGGAARQAEVTPEIQAAVARIAPQLEREGLFHVGADFVGAKILELNVFSPGGLRPAERLYGKDFGAAAIAALEQAL